MKIYLQASDSCRENNPDGPDQVELIINDPIQITYEAIRNAETGKFLDVYFVDGYWWHQGAAFSDIILVP